ncbi:hypothetical protein GTO27_11815 [Candidatus Bathyarchaeota archaeon]|nr:hypothetical protein [Candidatus Bathyarchaeota archaeon]
MEYNIGDPVHCPECGSVRGKIIWKSADGETIGIKCPGSGRRHRRRSVILVNLKRLYRFKPQDILTSRANSKSKVKK